MAVGEGLSVFVKDGVGVLVAVNEGVGDCVTVKVNVGVAVTVLVYVKVGVTVRVTVNVGVFGFKVGDTVAVRVGVNVGDQQSTSVSTQFEGMLARPANPISAWFEMVAQPEATPHHVYEPDVMETLPRFHLTTEPGAPPGVQPPVQPT